MVVVDQLVKAYVVANYQFDSPTSLIGDSLRVLLIHNRGGLFGMLQGQAQVFAVISIGVVAFLVAAEIRVGWRGWLTTLALGLLLGGAVGNFVDRITLSYVRDFFDLGVGSWRWYIFNVADAAITVSIGLILLIALFNPRSMEAAPSGATPSDAPDADDASRSDERLDA